MDGLDFTPEGEDQVAGVDEAGRGPLAGPVVAAAVILASETDIPGLADSKTLSSRAREDLAVQIRARARAWSVAYADVAEIDQHNILEATMLAMRRAVLNLSPEAQYVLVDGNRLPRMPVPGEPVIGGDGRVASIGAASILAKVERDRWMRRLAEAYPEYGFEGHMGYPTRAHLAALREYGPTPEHRRSFAPVRKLLTGRSGAQ